MTEGEAVIVNRDLISAEPGDRLSNIFDRLADSSNDDVAWFCETQCGGHVSVHMRNRLRCRRSGLCVDVAVVNAADSISNVVVLRESAPARECPDFTKGRPPYRLLLEAEKHVPTYSDCR